MNNEHAAHIRTLRRLIRAGLGEYRRQDPTEDAGAAVEYYRRLLREDAAKLRRDARRAAAARKEGDPAADAAA